MCIVKHEIKEEPSSEDVGCHLKLGIRKKNNGQWEISKRGDTDLVLSSDNDHARHMENKNSTLSCSIDDTNIGDEGYNLELARNDYPMTHVHDLDSSASDENAPPSTEQDVIVLSDSDDDVVMVLSPSAVNCGSAHDTGNLFTPSPPETSGVCGEQLGGGPDETPFLALKEGFDDLGLSFWECRPRDDPTYQMADLGILVTDNPGEVDEQVYGGDLGVAAAVANLLEDGHDGVSQPCTSTERDGAISLANLGDRTQTCGDGHPENRTAGSISGDEDCLTNARNAPQKRRNPGNGITALHGSAAGSRNDYVLTGAPPEE
ncbi:hypothetical protein PAHAL_3G001100 [Panicum hallii]|uniref:Uncharacterized protein n=1 Tax=Panicum hallii TaxID=206008 RepID=A0A2T8KGF0_9POAL|nr:hypothetical protein PAHAL_3G001100 [Panicum hallii]